MKNVVLGILVLALVAGGIAAFYWQQQRTPQGQRAEVLERFLAAVPDSLSDYHHEEIIGLFEVFYARADRGLVPADDVRDINVKLAAYAEKGEIRINQLTHFMAEVGYKTYKGEARYNLPDGVVDHPELNPESATMYMDPDTTGYAQWLANFKRQREAIRKHREQMQSQNEDG